MSVLVVTHESSFEHRAPLSHPERGDRLRAVMDGALSTEIPIVECSAPRIDRDLLEAVHSSAYIDRIEAFCTSGGGDLDQDTYAVPASYRASLHAAGAGPCAVDAIEEGIADAAFVAVRPPGHHAERAEAMGFCLFNNIAVTAAYLRGRGERVAIIDWDVHHGNGTQSAFYRDPDVLYLSLHQFPFYPGTGWIDEQGTVAGRGLTVNVPLPSGTSSTDYLAAFNRIVLPVVEQFAPDWTLISNGYDAHRRDPIGGLLLGSADYGTMASALVERTVGRNVIAMLEGGYDLGALEESSAETIRGLGGAVAGLDEPVMTPGSPERMVDLAIDAHSKYWELR